tara:strand:- start:1327 stop:1722 length:396 start_codon:yes stop_codon:yes gene_type:complete
MSDFIEKCSKHTLSSLFPDDVKNRPLVIFVNIIHILGVLAIQFGILLPPNMMKFYIIYLVLLLITYILLNNRCFMTEISNYISGKNYNTLCIKLTDAKKILVVYLIVAIIFEIFPDYSFYTLLTNLAKKNI